MSEPVPVGFVCAQDATTGATGCVVDQATVQAVVSSYAEVQSELGVIAAETYVTSVACALLLALGLGLALVAWIGSFFKLRGATS